MDKLEEIIIVGSGFAGSIMARLFAEQGRRIQVIEKREQIAGNMCDYIDENGIRIQKYGPHIFHTSIESVYITEPHLLVKYGIDFLLCDMASLL